METHVAKVNNIKAIYIQHVGSDLTTVNAARISFSGESQTLEERDKKLIKYLADNEHMSPFEHNSLTVLIECPLYIRSQIHRHRTFAYNEVSRRYTSEDLEFFIPSTLREQSNSNRQASSGDIQEPLNEILRAEMDCHHGQSLAFYERLIKAGVCREQARGVLPQNLMTKFWMTGNLRNWVHFLRLRLDNHAQLEVQEIAKQILDILKDKFPESTKALFKG